MAGRDRNEEENQRGRGKRATRREIGVPDPYTAEEVRLRQQCIESLPGAAPPGSKYFPDEVRPGRVTQQSAERSFSETPAAEHSGEDA